MGASSQPVRIGRPPLELYLLRHGRTALNDHRCLQGRKSDLPLDEMGREQALRVFAWLVERNVTFDRVVSSPLLRARQTAALASGVSSAAGRIATDDLLLEMDYGPFEGVPLSECASDPALAPFFADLAHAPAPPGMESLSHVRGRAAAFLAKVASEGVAGMPSVTARPAGPPHRILVCCHAIILKGMLEELDPASAGSWWSRRMGNCWLFCTRLSPGAGDAHRSARFEAAELLLKGDES